MGEQLDLVGATPQPTWARRKGRVQTCSRDPAAGPGTCSLWWESCPEPEKRNCYLAWTSSDAVVQHWTPEIPDDWAQPPAELPCGRAMLNRGLIEIRNIDGQPVEWRRRVREKADG